MSKLSILDAYIYIYVILYTKACCMYPFRHIICIISISVSWTFLYSCLNSHLYSEHTFPSHACSLFIHTCPCSSFVHTLHNDLYLPLRSLILFTMIHIPPSHLYFAHYPYLLIFSPGMNIHIRFYCASTAFLPHKAFPGDASCIIPSSAKVNLTLWLFSCTEDNLIIIQVHLQFSALEHLNF